MPIYEYECKSCGLIHEHYCNVSEFERERRCIFCEGIAKVILSLSSVHVFKPQVVGASLTGKDGEDINPFVHNKQELTDAINKYNDTERASKTGKVAILE